MLVLLWVIVTATMIVAMIVIIILVAVMAVATVAMALVVFMVVMSMTVAVGVWTNYFLKEQNSAISNHKHGFREGELLREVRVLLVVLDDGLWEYMEHAHRDEDPSCEGVGVRETALVLAAAVALQRDYSWNYGQTQDQRHTHQLQHVYRFHS